MGYGKTIPKGQVLMRVSKLCFFFSLFVISFPLSSRAQDAPQTYKLLSPEGAAPRWQLGVFAAGGFPPDYTIRSQSHFYFPIPPASGFGDGPFTASVKEQLDIYNLGMEVGWMGKRRHLPGVLRGKGEWVVEVMPLWVASYPRQTIGMRLVDQSGRVVPVLLYPTSIPEKSFFGSSITPWLMRWNFNKQDSPKVIPWVQIGGGLLWTDHKFPIVGIAGNGLLAVSVASIPRGESSVINFTPQVDAGVDIFRRRNRSVNAVVKAVHISNASLGDSNPGLNVTVQFSVGYSWWK